MREPNQAMIIHELKERARMNLAQPAKAGDAMDQHIRECWQQILNAPDDMTDEQAEDLCMHMAASVLAFAMNPKKHA